MEIDLIAMVERDLGPGHRSGRWVVWKCPFHDDTHPSFAVTNGDQGRGPGWKCFAASCDRHGGPVEWLMTYHYMSQEDAMEALQTGKNVERRERAAPEPTGPVYPPSKAWQKRAREVMARAKAALWRGAGDQAVRWAGRDGPVEMTPLNWLRGRGLTDDTIEVWGLGWIPRAWEDRGENWGLERPVKFFAGVLIPCEIGGEVWYLKTRLPGGQPKYLHALGSKPGVYMAQTLEFSERVVFCEGELDALLLWQEVQEFSAVVTLGSAVNDLNVATWGYRFLGTRERWLAYDADEAGAKGAEKLAWMKARRLEVPRLRPGDKDLTDYYQAGGDLAGWLRAQIAGGVG